MLVLELLLVLSDHVINCITSNLFSFVSHKLGMTPRPPHPKVLKTAMGSAELVSLGEDEDQISTLQTVLALKARGINVFGVEATENSTTLWDTTIPDENVAFVFGNELIGVGEFLVCLFQNEMAKTNRFNQMLMC